MKKFMSVVLSVVILASVIPIAAYNANITSEISLDEFTKQLQEMQAEHDDNYVSERVFWSNYVMQHNGQKKTGIILLIQMTLNLQV